MGHHCRANTRCVNTPGSYICECLPGYRRVDAFNCAEVDECGGGEHTCDVNADCINTQGSYDCACRKGWSGDGYTCKRKFNEVLNFFLNVHFSLFCIFVFSLS